MARHDLKQFREAAFRHALTAWNKVASQTGQPRHAFEVAVTQTRLANALASQERPAEADETLARGMGALRKLTQSYQDKEEYRSRLANEFNNRGILVGRLCPAEAGPLFRESVKQYVWLVHRSPANAFHREECARAQGNLALWQADHGRPEEAEQTHRQSLKGWGDLAAEFPASPSHATFLAYQVLGYFLETRKRPADAVVLYR